MKANLKLIIPALALSALLTGCGSMGGSKAKAAPADTTPPLLHKRPQHSKRRPLCKWILSTAEKKWPINAATKAKIRSP